MLDKIITFAAYAWLLGAALFILICPVLIGRPKTGEYTMLWYMARVVNIALGVTVVGRVLKWW